MSEKRHKINKFANYQNIIVRNSPAFDCHAFVFFSRLLMYSFWHNAHDQYTNPLASPLLITLQVVRTLFGFHLRECRGSSFPPPPLVLLLLIFQSISELILKYIFSAKMSVHLFPKEKVFKSASWNHLDFTLCSSIGLNSKHFPSESSACQISLAFLLFQGWLSFYISFFFFFNIIWCVLILFRHQAQKSCVWYCLIACIQKRLMGILYCVIHSTPRGGGWL